MSRQINLYNPLLRPKGFSFTSANAMLYGAGIAVAVAALVAVYEDYQLRDVQTRAQAVDQAYKDATARHDKLAAELTQRKPNTLLETEVTALDAQLKGRREIIETLKSGVVGNTGGFSEYMRAFSRQNVNGLWLTAFDIATGGNELALQGRALSADLVASYLRQLNQEKALQGRQFAALRISQPQPAAVPPKAAPEQKADKDAKAGKDIKPVPPRYLDFTISTLEPAENSHQAAKAVAVPPPLLGVIDPAVALGAAKGATRQEEAR